MKPPEPQQPGIAPNESQVYFFSLLFPFRNASDIHRDVFIFVQQPDNSLVVEKKRYSELSSSQKQKIRKCTERNRTYFILTVAILAAALAFNYTVFSILLIVATLVTLYEGLDRRVRYLYLRREYRRKEQYAQAESARRKKENRTAD